MDMHSQLTAALSTQDTRMDMHSLQFVSPATSHAGVVATNASLLPRGVPYQQFIRTRLPYVARYGEGIDSRVGRGEGEGVKLLVGARWCWIPGSWRGSGPEKLGMGMSNVWEGGMRER